MATESTPFRTHDFPCSACGAELFFEPGTDVLRCPHCEHQQALEAVRAAAVEHDLDAALARNSAGPVRDWVANGHTVRCSSCGAETVTDAAATRCAFCDAPVVIETALADRLAPETLVPFAIDSAQAAAAFDRFVRTRWFAPRALARQAKLGRLRGVYLPYWTYDARTTARYRGRKGMHAYRAETTRGANGQTSTRMKRYTIWSAASGQVAHDFDDVLIPATAKLPAALLTRLMPWDLGALRRYEPGYLAGFAAQIYDVNVAEGFTAAQAQIRAQLETLVRRDIGGNEQRISSLEVDYRDTRFKHLLLPTWLASFRYRDRVFHFMVNAQTGNAHGERPYSMFKIVSLLLSIAALIGGLWFFLRD